MKIGVLISGRGSNLQSLIDASRMPDFGAEIALVISNIPDVYGLERARIAGIPTRVVDHKAFVDRTTFEDTLHAELSSAGVELVCLAGFMRILTARFVDRWYDRLINIHPSLLPNYKGLHTHQRAIEAGEKFGGCTIHFVRPAMDDGPIILQAPVPILPGDTPDTLAARVLVEEHRIYPLAVKLIAEGRARVDGERVIVADAEAPANGMINPAG